MTTDRFFAQPTSADPPVAADGRCLTCRRPRHPERSRKYAREIAERDPWCGRTCAEAWHATHRVGAA